MSVLCDRFGMEHDPTGILKILLYWWLAYILITSLASLNAAITCRADGMVYLSMSNTVPTGNLVLSYYLFFFAEYKLY